MRRPRRKAAADGFPTRDVSLLGLVTIVAYGAWYYSFGVLLDPILEDTGWSETWVTASFSGPAAVGALLAPTSGRLADRFPTTPLFLAAAIGAAVGFTTASVSHSPVMFLAGSLLGGISLSGFAFYHVTQTAAIRLAPDRPAKAAGIVTLFGAFAATVYLPLSAYLSSMYGWRPALRMMTAITASVLVLVALLTSAHPTRRTRPAPTTMRGLFESTNAKRYAAATAGIGVATGTVLVYQVPLMTSAGLTVTTAASIAGARGIAQFAGRLPIPWLTRTIGTQRSLQLAFGAVAIGIALLAAARHPVLAIAYVVIAGLGIGAISPLQGVYASELFDNRHLGHAMGVAAMIFGLSGAAGPLLVAVLSDMTDTRWWAIAVAAPAAAAATLLMSNTNPQ